jgi:hypothetical protein
MVVRPWWPFFALFALSSLSSFFNTVTYGRSGCSEQKRSQRAPESPPEGPLAVTDRRHWGGKTLEGACMHLFGRRILIPGTLQKRAIERLPEAHRPQFVGFPSFPHLSLAQRRTKRRQLGAFGRVVDGFSSFHTVPRYAGLREYEL